MLKDNGRRGIVHVQMSAILPALYEKLPKKHKQALVLAQYTKIRWEFCSASSIL